MALGFRWLDGHTPLFLNFYKQHECLWNTKHKDYKNTLVRLTALNTLRSELNLPGLSVDDVKSKIKSIRTRYLVELHRIIASERNGDVVSYVPRLFWFNQADLFLRAVVSPKQKISDLVINNCQSEQAQDDSSNDGDTNIETKAETEEEESTPPPKATKSSDRRLRSLSRRSRTSTKRSRHFQVAPVESVLKKLTPETENEFDAFCRSLAIQLKNMPLDRALMCQENLQRIMTQERLSLYKNSGEDSKNNFVFYAEDPIQTSEP